MKKIEKEFLEDYSNSMKSTKNFDDISKHIDYSKYKKKKSFWNSKNLSILVTSFAIILTVSIVIPLTLQGNEPSGPSDSSEENIVYTEYDAFIKDAFENNINDGPYLDMGGPSPQPPIVDDYFNKQDYNKPPMDNGKPDDEGFGEIIDNFTGRTYNYIYEVDYQDHTVNYLYACVYIDKKLAQKVYEENKEICDATPASPLNAVNGTVVDWFYSNSYYNESKVKWYNFADKDTILSEIDGMVCCGVYLPQQRIITKEVFSQTKMHIVDEL